MTEMRAVLGSHYYVVCGVTPMRISITDMLEFNILIGSFKIATITPASRILLYVKLAY